MLDIEKSFEKKLFRVDVLTPIHVGSGEKYLYGVDYIVAGNELLFYNYEELLRLLSGSEIKQFTQTLASGKFDDIKSQVLRYKQKVVLVHKKQKLEIEKKNEIFSQIIDGCGHSYIPGSSIKGSIRSVLFNYKIQKNQSLKQAVCLKQEDNYQKVEKELFGKIDANLLRSLRVSDVYLQKTKVYPVKIFSADINDGEENGRWKDQRKGGHNDQFNPKGFTSYYESICPGDFSALTVDIGSNLAKEGIHLFTLLKKQMDEYLKKEIAYYKKFQNESLIDIIDDLERLKSINSENNTCVLRVGGGSGYYNITGDWQYEDHLQKDNYQIRAKTRKFAFEYHDGEYKFQPFGFVKLTVISKEEFDKLIEGKKQQLKDNESIGLNQTDEIEKKPHVSHYFSGKIKNGAGPIDAEIVFSGKPNRVKLYIENQDDIPIEMTGMNSPLLIGTNVSVRINSAKKDGKIIQVGFLKYL